MAEIEDDAGDASTARSTRFLGRRTMTLRNRDASRRSALSVLAVAAIALALSDCALRGPDTEASHRTEPPVDAETAKQQMIDAVDDVTGRLGDDWKARTGPDYAEDCALPDGAPGAQWRYLVGSSRTGTPEEDAQNVTDHWKASGLTTERRNSSDGPAVFAGGGDQFASISLYAYSGNYTVQAVSSCFPGDADDL
jgi:hypothetical protein